MLHTDICVIGGGASGMVGAISASSHDNTVMIIEKKSRLGSKLRATGNGRCNMDNIAIKGWENNSVFFASLGISTRTDVEGRIYPYSEDANDVANLLESHIKALGVTVHLNSHVKSVERMEDSKFKIVFQRTDINEEFVVEAEKLLLATGGKSYPQFGTTGDGYKMARKLGHTVSKLIPVLSSVQVVEDIKGTGLSGVRAKGRVSLLYRGESVFSEYGEVQFSDLGISGICVFNMTRFMNIPNGKDVEDGLVDYEIIVDFAPDIHSSEVRKLIDYKINVLKQTEELSLSTLVKPKLAKAIATKKLGGDDVVKQIKAMKFTPKKINGWKYAQVTRGGVLLSEIDSRTMESKLVKNLFFAGEVTDYDGPCGGYNLHNAWATGILAGNSMHDDTGSFEDNTDSIKEAGDI